MKHFYFLLVFLSAIHLLHAQEMEFVPYPEGKTVDYTYDNLNEMWVFQDTLLYTYDSVGHVIQQLTKDSTGQPITRSVSDWSDDPNWSYVTQDWMDNMWVNRLRGSFIYDSHGNKDINKTENWINGAWVVSQYSTHDSTIYSMDDLPLERYQYTWDTTTLDWKPRQPQALWIFTYNEDLTLSSGSTFDYVNDAYEITDSVQHFYNAMGMESKKYHFAFDSAHFYGMKPYQIDTLLDNIHYFMDGNGDSASYVSWSTNNLKDSVFVQHDDTTLIKNDFDNWSYIINYAHSDTLGEHSWNHHVDSLSTNSGFYIYTLDPYSYDSNVYYNTFSWDSASGLPTQVVSASLYAGTDIPPSFQYSHKISFGEYQVVTGVARQSNLDDQLVIYPNPVSTFLNISSEGNELDRVEVYSLSGKRVLTSEIRSSRERISVASLQNGAYFLKFYKDGKPVAMRKLIKQ